MSEYKILRVAGILWTERNKGVQTSQLERLVADHIAYGWVPIGGVSVEIQEGRTDALLQAMWRNEPRANV